MKKLLLILIILCMFILPSSAYLMDYKNGTQVNVTSSGSTGTLTNYPIALTLSNASGISGGGIIYTNGTTRPDWGDINCTDINDGLRSFFISYNESTATSVPLYVNVSSITSSGLDAAIVYYGSSTITTSRQNPTPTLLQYHGSASSTFNDSPIVNPVNSSYLAHVRLTVAGAQQMIGYTDVTSLATASNNTNFQEGYTPMYVYSSKVGAQVSTTQTAPSPNVYLRYAINRTNTYVNFTMGSATPLQISTVANLPTANVGLAFLDGDAGSSDQNWSFIRKWTQVEPAQSGFTKLIAPLGSNTLNASFTQTPNPSVHGQIVTFTDASVGNPISYLWTFEGTNTSNLQNPTYTFKNPGTYQVMLNLTNSTGAWSNTSRQQVVLGDAVGNVDNYYAISMPNDAKKYTIDPLQQTMNATAGNAIWSAILLVNDPSNGVITVVQQDGTVTHGSWSYHGWPYATWSCSMGSSSFSESFYILSPMSNMHVEINPVMNGAQRGIGLQYAPISTPVNFVSHTVTQPTNPSPIISISYKSSDPVTATYYTTSIGENLKNFLYGASDGLSGTVKDITDAKNKFEQYIGMVWGIFSSLMYWLQFLFIDHIILTVLLYMMGSAAFAMLTSRNIYTFFKTFFKQQAALFTFIANSFYLVIQILARALGL